MCQSHFSDALILLQKDQTVSNIYVYRNEKEEEEEDVFIYMKF